MEPLFNKRAASLSTVKLAVIARLPILRFVRLRILGY
jgi:hypothetical protein